MDKYIGIDAHSASCTIAVLGPTGRRISNELGRGLPYGEALVREWRERYPSIRRALLVTGTAVAAGRGLEGVDCVLPKPVEMGEIVGELRG